MMLTLFVIILLVKNHVYNVHSFQIKNNSSLRLELANTFRTSAPLLLLNHEITSSTFPPAITTYRQSSLLYQRRAINLTNAINFLSHKNSTSLHQSISSDNNDHDSKNSNRNQKFDQIKILGICGSIGSGKSFACHLLASNLSRRPSSSSAPSTENTVNTALNNSMNDSIIQNAIHIDTDTLAHGVYAPGSNAIKEIHEEFGDGVLNKYDGTVDRKALGSIVFQNPDQMKKLEGIVWPHVKQLLLERLHTIDKSLSDQMSASPSDITTSTSSTLVIVEAAVLLDANWDEDDLFDGIWVVKASPEVATQRLIKHRNMVEGDIQKRIDAQFTRRGIGNVNEELSRGCIHAVILNDGEGTQGEGDLWNRLMLALNNPLCWKEGRCP